MKFGILLPTRMILLDNAVPKNANSLLKIASIVDSAGLDSVWVGDSLTAKPRLEPLSVLSAISSTTKRVRIGTAVILAGLRNPVLLAHAASTIDLMSEGRLVLGMGVGGAFNSQQKQEWANVGVDHSTRANRFEEVVHLVKRLTKGETVTFHGQHFNIENVSISPKSPNVDGVKILIACHWHSNIDSQFQRAAKLGDGYISISDSPDEYSDVTNRVRYHAEQLNIDFTKMERVFYMTINIGNDQQSSSNEADLFLRKYYGINIWKNRWGPYGPPDIIIDRIREYSAAGAETLVIRFASFDQETQIKEFVETIVPKI